MFYRDILGFDEMWHGGKTDSSIDWVAMRVPDGSDWLEYMLNVRDPTPKTLGVMHHFGLGIVNRLPHVHAGVSWRVPNGTSLRPTETRIYQEPGRRRIQSP